MRKSDLTTGQKFEVGTLKSDRHILDLEDVLADFGVFEQTSSAEVSMGFKLCSTSAPMLDLICQVTVVLTVTPPQCYM